MIKILELLQPLIASYLALALLSASVCSAYPLDGFDETDIARLDGYYHSLLTESGKLNLTAGALLSITELSLSKPKFGQLQPFKNLALQRSLESAVPKGISISLLDISDANSPRYAEINGTQSFVPGSVGKLMVAVSFFDALKRLYPNSTTDRDNILRTRIINANEFIQEDEHVVPFWNSVERKIFFRPLVMGDSANLWTFLDWMLSASSNAAASMIMREVLLMNYFGSQYPPSDSAANSFLRSPSANSIVSDSFLTPLYRLRIEGNPLFQATFFTKAAKSIIPGLGSSATTRGLVELLLKIERGEVVDAYSSLELKRLIYLTQKRERYAGNSALDNAAIYFKAGSLYKCRSGGGCEKYEGDLENMLNGVAIIEDPVGTPKFRYLMALSTNILRYNSDRLHNEIAGRIHKIVTE